MKIRYIVAALLITINAHARIDSMADAVSHQVKKKLLQAQNSFAQPTTPFLYTGNNNTAYYLKRIRLQFEPFVEFDIAIFEMKVFPIIEFRWTRKNPKGWVNYKKDA
jgi:hypothetical protein